MNSSFFSVFPLHFRLFIYHKVQSNGPKRRVKHKIPKPRDSREDVMAEGILKVFAKSWKRRERIFVRSPSETFHLIQCYASLADNGHYSSLILSLMEICFSFPETLQSLFQVINFNPCDFTLDSSLKETEGDPCLALFMSWDYTFPTYLSYNASHKSLWLTVCSPL